MKSSILRQGHFFSLLLLSWTCCCCFFFVAVHGSAPVAESPELLEETSSETFKFVHKTVIIPHDQKKHRGGEDAATSDQLLVVADGVGGWANKGVNPGLYSRLLTKTIVEMFEKDKEKQSPLSLSEIVEQANQYAASQHLGSATCTAVRLTGPNTLQTLNIGDSGYSIHRRTSSGLNVVFASEPGQKQFNFPHQIGGKYGDVVAEVADHHTHSLQKGDILVVYSDGVSDNLHPQEYHECIDRYLTADGIVVSYSLVADCIARQAYVLGKDKQFDSPFAQGARLVGKRYMGGKHDDITVTVAQVARSSHNDSSSKSGGSPSSAPSNQPEDKDDPHYTESIFIYTGPVPSKEDLPSMEEVLHRKPVSAMGEEEL